MDEQQEIDLMRKRIRALRALLDARSRVSEVWNAVENSTDEPDASARLAALLDIGHEEAVIVMQMPLKYALPERADRISTELRQLESRLTGAVDET